LLEPKQREALRDDERTVHVSAVRGIGIATALERIDQLLEEDPVSRVRLSVPQREGKVLAMLAAQARIYSREYRDGVVEMETEAPESVIRRVREFVTKGSS
jgi:50S ribosomal subunit-associated GTPase HflX